MNIGRPKAGAYYADLYSNAQHELDALRTEVEELRNTTGAAMFLTLTSELAALREELATERSGFAESLERCRIYQDEQQARLAAAEQRNVVQRGLLHRALNVIRGMRYDELEAAIVEELNIQPTESGASE